MIYSFFTNNPTKKEEFFWDEDVISCNDLNSTYEIKHCENHMKTANETTNADVCSCCCCATATTKTSSQNKKLSMSPLNSGSTPPKILTNKIIHRLHNHHLTYLDMQQKQSSSPHQHHNHQDEVIPEEGKQRLLGQKNKKLVVNVVFASF